ncbi:MAG: hypothetical protein ACXVHU_05985 [Methanobacterium sp.]
MNVFKINKRIAFIAYILLDTIFVGLGMGVPFFCILFGFPVGWYLSKRLTLSKRSSNQILSKILKYGLFTGMVTFILMIIIWIPFSSMLLDPNANFRNFGIPMILYDPKMSFIGWMILMVIISPFLQLLTTIFASNVTLWKISKKNR